MKRRVWTVIPAAALALLVGSLASGIVSSQGQRQAKQAPPPAEAVALATANNEFGLDLFSRLHRDGRNTFISPASVATALHMAAAGAKGDTEAEMHKTLRAPDLELGPANRALIGELNSRSGVTLNVANSLWPAEGRLQLTQSYVDSVRKDFGGDVIPVSFSDPQTRAVINKWVADRTNQLIPELLQDLDPEAIAVLVNAVYFKGDWRAPFDPAKTKDATFHLPGDAEMTIAMMSRKAYIYYGVDNGTQIARLPYGKDEAMSMLIVLPSADSCLDALVKGITLEQVRAWQHAARFKQDGTLKLPRFKLKYREEISRTLMDMGIRSAFSLDKADFSGVGVSDEGPLAINRVIHEAVVMVNEKGTEAAAATAVTWDAGPPPRPFHMTCDRPFLFLITDDATGAILFMGTVYRPEALE